jgi:hypothetical protein
VQPALEPIPLALTPVLDPLREASSIEDVQETHRYNMERTGICYVQYTELVRALRQREAASVSSEGNLLYKRQ